MTTEEKVARRRRRLPELTYNLGHPQTLQGDGLPPSEVLRERLGDAVRPRET